MDNVRTFRAASMCDALALVKKELGPRAIILGTRHVPAGGVAGLVGRAKVEITAAPPEKSTELTARNAQTEIKPVAPLAWPRHGALLHRQPHAVSAAAGRSEANPILSDLPDEARSFYTRLVQSEVAEQLAGRLVREAARTAGASSQRLRLTLLDCIARTVPVAGGIELTPGVPRRVALIGPPGAGKTTTLAKLAAHFKLRMRQRVAIVSLDMHRPGTHDQVRRYAELIGVPMFAAQTGSQVREILRDLPPVELVLIDTHGVSARDRGRFARLAALLRAAHPDELHLTLPASLSPGVQQRTATAFEPLGITRVVLTRLDEAVGLGVVLTAMEKLSWGLSYVTTGQRVPTDFQEACGRKLAEELLPAAR